MRLTKKEAMTNLKKIIDLHKMAYENDKTVDLSSIIETLETCLHLLSNDSGTRDGLEMNKREKASEYLHALKGFFPMREINEALDIAISNLRCPTREQVERMRGEWIDTDGEKVPVDKYGNTRGWAECSVCGEYLTASEEYNCAGHFCPACGAPMTDEAVDLTVKRLEVLKDGKND